MIKLFVFYPYTSFACPNKFKELVSKISYFKTLTETFRATLLTACEAKPNRAYNDSYLLRQNKIESIN